MAWTTPKTWAGSELLTASDLNQYVSDNLSLLYELVSSGGRKNLLHNGACQVAQRGTSTSSISSASSALYTADRWAVDVSGLGTWTQSVENDAPAGSGWRKSLKMYCSSADAAPATTDTVKVVQAIEGQNVQSVKKGTASAEQLTLSFWTKSNKTGTYIVELYDNDNNRHCAKSYTVTSSATWEEQSVTFPADLTGAFDNDNAGSLHLYFHLAEGPSQTSGTLATTWAPYTAANRAVGQTNLGAANANYWMVTGVQLETGDTATGYQHKNYDQELAECQRYYFRITPPTSTYHRLGVGQCTSTTGGEVIVYHPVVMRGQTTADIASVSNYAMLNASGFSLTVTGLSVTLSNTYMTALGFTVASGLVAGNFTILMSNNNTTGYLGLSADL